MHKRLYFHIGVVIPASKVFFSPTQSYSFQEMLVLESIIQLRTFGLGPWEQTKSLEMPPFSAHLQELCLLPVCTGDLTWSLGWRQTRRDTWMFASCFFSSGERAVALAGMHHSESLERHCMGCVLGGGKLILSSLLLREIGLWTYKQRCFKGRQLHP